MNVKVQQLVNTLAATAIGEEVMNTLVAEMVGEMEDGYRLVFPILARSREVAQCVALLALATDPRLEAIRQLVVPVDATHVFICLAFSSAREWETQATQMAKLFPEQPTKPTFIIDCE